MKKYEIWLANLNPNKGTEAGKLRPVIIIQTNFLNDVNHSSTIIFPITTNLSEKENILRVKLKIPLGKLKSDCEIMLDQIRAIENTRFIEKIADLPLNLQSELNQKKFDVLN
jgi:mRNA interferase MazF